MRNLPILEPDGSAEFVWAPGRINVLGEHTDTSFGFCLPAAVDRGLLCAYAKAGDSKISVTSLDVPGRAELSQDFEVLPGSAPFARYVSAVALVLAERGIHSPGLALCVGSTIPAGGGMSSSAAFCVALTLAMVTAAGATLAPLEVALVAQAAEHLVGVHCGLMDQYAIVHGKEGQALLLDTRTQTHEEVPLDLGEYVFVVGDTGKSRGLVDSEYNARRSQVEEAARILDGGKGTVKSLRDATPELLAEKKDELGALLFRRASHVVEENARTVWAGQRLAGAAAPGGPAASSDRQAVVRELGRALDASHSSLRDLFAVSCAELDALVEALRDQGDDLVPGARMMGGGFGGCVIALVKKSELARVLERATESYRARTERAAAFFPVEIRSGARLVAPALS